MPAINKDEDGSYVRLTQEEPKLTLAWDTHITSYPAGFTFL